MKKKQIEKIVDVVMGVMAVTETMVTTEITELEVHQRLMDLQDPWDQQAPMELKDPRELTE